LPMNCREQFVMLGSDIACQEQTIDEHKPAFSNPMGIKEEWQDHEWRRDRQAKPPLLAKLNQGKDQWEAEIKLLLERQAPGVAHVPAAIDEREPGVAEV